MDGTNKNEFKDYMNEEIPGYETLLDEEQISHLLQRYNEWKNWSDIAATSLSKQFSSQAGIDYTNSYEKAMEQVSIKGQELRKLIDEIKKLYNIETKEINKESDNKKYL